MKALGRRSAATRLRDEALWLGAITALWVAEVGAMALVGVPVGIGLVAVMIAGQWFGWGLKPRFAQAWTPSFRVHGDNPDVGDGTARIKVPGDVVVEMVDTGGSFTSIGVFNPGHGLIAGLDSTVVRPILAAQGTCRVRIGVDPSSDGVDATIQVPAGAWMVTVRDYEVDRLAYPQATVVRE